MSPDPSKIYVSLSCSLKVQVDVHVSLVLLRPVYTGEFRRGNSMQFLWRYICIKSFSNMFETPTELRRQIAVKLEPVYTRDFEVATFARQKLHRVAATKIACVNVPSHR